MGRIFLFAAVGNGQGKGAGRARESDAPTPWDDAVCRATHFWRCVALQAPYPLRLARLCRKLAVVQRCVETALGKQLLVRALLYDIAITHHQNNVRVAHGG